MFCIIYFAREATIKMEIFQKYRCRQIKRVYLNNYVSVNINGYNNLKYLCLFRFALDVSDILILYA